MLLLCPSGMSSGIATGLLLWAGALLFLCTTVGAMVGWLRAHGRALRGSRSLPSLVAAAAVTAAHLRLFASLVPVRPQASYTTGEAAGLVLLFVIVCGLPLGWLFTAARAMRARPAETGALHGSR